MKRQEKIKREASMERSVSQEKAFLRGARYADATAVFVLNDLLKEHFGTDQPAYVDEIEDIVNRFEERLGL